MLIMLSSCKVIVNVQLVRLIDISADPQRLIFKPHRLRPIAVLKNLRILENSILLLFGFSFFSFCVFKKFFYILMYEDRTQNYDHEIHEEYFI